MSHFCSTHRLAALLIAAVASLLLLTAACGSSSNKKVVAASTAPGVAVTVAASVTVAGTASGPAVQAAIAGVAFPVSIAVKPGASITWTNKDAFAHTVTADAGQPETFDSRPIAAGGTFMLALTKAGTYTYHCSIHASMHGSIIVGDQANGVITPAAPATSTVPDYKY